MTCSRLRPLGRMGLPPLWPLPPATGHRGLDEPFGEDEFATSAEQGTDILHAPPLPESLSQPHVREAGAPEGRGEGLDERFSEDEFEPDTPAGPSSGCS